MGNPRRRRIRKHMVGRAFAKRSASGSFAENISNFVKENSFSTEAKNGVRSDIDNIMLRELYGEGGVNGGDVLNEGGRGASLDNTTFFHGQTMDLGATPLIIDNGIIGGVAGIGVRKTTENLGVTGSAVGVYIISSARLETGAVGASSGTAATDAEGILFGPQGNRGIYTPELEDTSIFGPYDDVQPRKFYIKPTGWGASDQLVITVSGTTALTGTSLDGNTQCQGDSVVIKQGDNNAVLTPADANPLDTGELVCRISGGMSYDVTVTRAAANDTNGVYIEYTPGRSDNVGKYSGWLVKWRYNAI
jgi:hypothetical protein